MSGLKKERVLNAVAVIRSQYSKENGPVGVVVDYESPLVSKQIARVVLSYVDYVNRTVWRKG